MTEPDWPTHESVNSHEDPFLFELIEYLCTVRRIEPDVTEAIMGAIPSGAAPHGLQFRVKHWRSLKRKAEGVIAMDPYAYEELQTIAEIVRKAVRKIDDVLRYSLLSEAHNKIPEHASTFIRHTRDGKISTVSILNSYHASSRYKGLHAILSLKERFSIDMWCEVQFHSPSSVEAYMDTHILYEELRICDDLSKRQELHDTIAARYELLENIEIGTHGFPVPVKDRVLRRPI